jgi:hypothetical protein
VIGKRASHVKAADAMSYVFGYTNFIDGSARGVVPPTNVFYQMKSRDTFAPIGSRRRIFTPSLRLFKKVNSLLSSIRRIIQTRGHSCADPRLSRRLGRG